MSNEGNTLLIGHYRALTLWGQRGTRQILKLRYPKTLLDNRTLDMAYTRAGVARVQVMGFNWVFLMGSWGFPPEDEAVDWVAFRKAVSLYQNAGIQVCGGVQVLAYVPQGSYAEKEWAAHDPWGKPIPYATGHLLACWQDSAWQAEVQRRITLLIEGGVQGVFFAAPWLGDIPFTLAQDVPGAYCHCERCQAAFAAANARKHIPSTLNPRNSQVRAYLQWRAEQAVEQLGIWADHARTLKPDIMIAAEGNVTLAGHSMTGNESPLQRLSAGQNVTLLRSEMPQPHPEGLRHNAVYLALARLRTSEIPLASHVGPRRENAHQDTDESLHRFVTAMGEACALNVLPAINGSDFVANQSRTLLLHDAFEKQRAAIGRTNAWLEQHAPWLNLRTNASPLAVYAPRNIDDDPLAALVVRAACQTLILHGLPLRIVDDGDWDGVQTVIVPPGEVNAGRLADFAASDGRVIALQQARPGCVSPLWTRYKLPQRRRLPVDWPLVGRLVDRMRAAMWRLAHTPGLLQPLLRRVQGRFAVQSEITPPVAVQRELVSAIGLDIRPRAEGEGALLFTIWREPGGNQQWHLVNYLDEPQRVTLHTPSFASGWVFSPTDNESVKVFGNAIMVTVWNYKVLRVGVGGPEAPG
ncbi:MAG: hypothetical protein GYB65_16575 [Chloroflexi bacterium]|nr:hypothetical protein [Chloroflexota bacterium]